MEQVYRIKYLKKFEGKSLRKIAEITGHDFETVKKYVDRQNFNFEPRPKQQRRGKLLDKRIRTKSWTNDTPEGAEYVLKRTVLKST